MVINVEELVKLKEYKFPGGMNVADMKELGNRISASAANEGIDCAINYDELGVGAVLTAIGFGRAECIRISRHAEGKRGKIGGVFHQAFGSTYGNLVITFGSEGRYVFMKVSTSISRGAALKTNAGQLEPEHTHWTEIMLDVIDAVAEGCRIE